MIRLRWGHSTIKIGAILIFIFPVLAVGGGIRYSGCWPSVAVVGPSWYSRLPSPRSEHNPAPNRRTYFPVIVSGIFFTYPFGVVVDRADLFFVPPAERPPILFVLLGSSSGCFAFRKCPPFAKNREGPLQSRARAWSWKAHAWAGFGGREPPRRSRPALPALRPSRTCRVVFADPFFVSLARFFHQAKDSGRKRLTTSSRPWILIGSSAQITRLFGAPPRFPFQAGFPSSQ